MFQEKKRAAAQGVDPVVAQEKVARLGRALRGADGGRALRIASGRLRPDAGARIWSTRNGLNATMQAGAVPACVREWGDVATGVATR